jgi:hypothetical protein
MQRAMGVVVCWLVACSVGHAQSGDWNSVTALSPGTRLRIELVRRRQAEGILQNVDDAQLTLVKRVPAPRTEIRKIERLGHPSVGKFARWGFLVGVVSGASLAYATAEGSKGAWALFQSVGWGSIGALIGSIDGAQSRERIPIYEAP